MEHHTIRGVIFDLDGTLLDSTGLWSSIDRAILKQFDRPVPPDISEVVKKMTIQQSADYFIEQFNLPLTAQALIGQIEEMAQRSYAESLPLKEGAQTLLDFLDRKKIPYGVITANYPGLARSALERLGLMHRISFLLTEQEQGMAKTDPALFRLGAQKFSLGRRQVCVCEDSLHCIETARTAGFFTAGVYDPASAADWTEIQHTATVSVHSLAELTEVF